MDVNSFIKEIIDNAEKNPSAPERDTRFDNPLNVIKDGAVVLSEDNSVEEPSLEELAESSEEVAEETLEEVENLPENLEETAVIEEPADIDKEGEIGAVIVETSENIQKIPSEEDSESIELVEIALPEYEAVMLPLVNDEYPVADASSEEQESTEEETTEPVSEEPDGTEENPEENPNEFLRDVRAELKEIEEEEALRPVRPHEKSELVKVKCRFRRTSVVKKPLFVVGLILLILGGVILGAGVGLITIGGEFVLPTLSVETARIVYIASIALGAVLAVAGAVLFARSLSDRRTEFVMETVSIVPDYNGKKLDKDTFEALKKREIKRTKNSL